MLQAERDKGNIITMPMNWGTLRLSNLPKVTQEVSGRAGNWTQISWIAGQDFNHKAIFRLSLSLSFPAPLQSFHFSTLLKKIAFKNPFGNTLGMLWPPQLYLAQL